MLPEPNALVQRMGVVIIQNFCGLIPLTLFHGAFIMLFYISTASLLRRDLRSRSTQAMLALAVISFICTTVSWAAYIAFVTKQIRSAMIDNLEVPLNERLILSNHETYKSVLVINWANDILPIISDSVVVWRAWVLFFENRWVMIGPLTLLLGVIATTLTSSALEINFDIHIESSKGISNLPSKFYHATLVLSLATNALATLMVGYKLWSHRTFLTEIMGQNRHFSRAQNVLLVLVESGMIYFAFQLTALTIVISLYAARNGGARGIAAIVFEHFFYKFSAMYPLIVIILVNHQRSIVDTYGFTSIDLNGAQLHKNGNASERPATFGHLSFAPPAKMATESLESRNAAVEGNTDLDVVVEQRIENVDATTEKQQVRSVPF